MGTSAKWILIVDDDDETRGFLKETLQSHSKEFSIVEAKDGLEATKKLGNQKFDCIVTDFNMPKRTGKELMDLAKKTELNAKTPFVLVTGYTDPIIEKLNLQIAYLQKPFSEENLVKTVLQQIQLGTTDRRVPALLFNTVIGTLDSLLKEELHLNCERLPPQRRENFSHLSGKTLAFLKVSSGNQSGWMLFACEEKFLKSLPDGSAAMTTKEQLQDKLIKKITKIKKGLSVSDLDTFILNYEKIKSSYFMNPEGIEVSYKTPQGEFSFQVMAQNFALGKMK